VARLRSLLALGLAGLALTGSPAVELNVLEPGSAPQLTALGNEALMQGRYETAIEHYRHALALERTSFNALFNLALAHQQLGQADEAKRWYEAALSVSHDHPEVLCNLGFLAFRAGDFAGAVTRFEDAAHLAAGSAADAADYWFNAGGARERLQQWPEAKRAYEECLALNPAHFAAHYNLGTLHLGPLDGGTQALEQAEAHLAKARDLQPARAEAWVNLAICHERAGHGDPDGEFDQAVKIAPAGFLNQALWQRALYHDRQKPPRRTAMRDDLKAILANDPDHPEVNGRLGAYHFALGEYEQAVRYLEREVEGQHFDPASATDVESHYLLAVIYTDHRPDPTKALQHATDYYQQRPNSAKIHELRRRALRLGGASDGASASLPAPAAAAPGHAAPADHATPISNVPPPAHGAGEAPGHGAASHSH
jgi:tetratricopeptide (TPR) repeat protein